MCHNDCGTFGFEAPDAGPSSVPDPARLPIDYFEETFRKDPTDMATIRVPPRKGSRHGSAKLNEPFVVRIRRLARELGYCDVASLARSKRVTYRAVKDALTGATYQHVDRVARPYRGPTRKPSAGCVVRIDSESTHGWQGRYQGRSKFFSDGIHGKRRALKKARAWLKTAA